MKLGMVLPVYCDKNKTYVDRIDKFTTRLVHLKSIDNLEFLVNIQSEDSKDYHYVREVLGSTGPLYNNTWEFKFLESSYYNPVSMAQIRNDCMMLDSNLDLYCFIDDDVYYNAGAAECYQEILDFFEEDPQLGMVMSAGFLGGYNYKHQLKYAVNKQWQTGRGLFFRSLKGVNCYGTKSGSTSPLYDDTLLENCVGGCEEFLGAVEELSAGRKLATHFNNPTTHKITVVESQGENKVGNKTNSQYGHDVIHDPVATYPGVEFYLDHRFSGLEIPRINSLKDQQAVLTLIHKEVSK